MSVSLTTQDLYLWGGWVVSDAFLLWPAVFASGGGEGGVGKVQREVGPAECWRLIENWNVYNILSERERPVEDSPVKGFAVTAGGCVAAAVVWTLLATSFLPECWFSFKVEVLIVAWKRGRLKRQRKNATSTSSTSSSWPLPVWNLSWSPL